MTTPQQNKISASNTSIGFDYQFYYFFYLTLGLKLGESIGIEVKDDIHVDFPDGTTELLQTKHSVQTAANGEPINLTELSIDLWKTLSNWATIVNEQQDKKAYLNKTRFRLVTNKANRSNQFIEKVRSFQRGEIKYAEIKKYIESLKKATSSTDIKLQIEIVLSLKVFLKEYLGNLYLDFEEDDLIKRIKDRITEKIYITEKVNDVYQSLHSALRDKNYLDVKAGKICVISFSDFKVHFQNCFKLGFAGLLPKRDLPFLLPDSPNDQLFIQQLTDIGDILPSDEEKVIELTTYMLKFINNYSYWETNDGLLPSQKQEFERNSKLIWKNSFEKSYRKISKKVIEGANLEELESEIKDAALECLDEMKKQSLVLDETTLDLELSNGHFYYLTEEKTIGWHLSWKTRYECQ